MNTRRHLCVALLAAPLLGGPYDGPASMESGLAVPFDHPEIVAWASGYADLVRGPAQLGTPDKGFASFGSGTYTLGPAGEDVYDVVSLGDGGRITLTFDAPITDGPGWDFAVFENSFGDLFLELAFVEVSSDGVHFFRFPSVSLTPASPQVSTWGGLDATDLYNLAGKYRLGFGTPFDLTELDGLDPRLDIRAITHVRVIDAVGTVDAGLASLDSLGNIVNDPWPTPFATGGFDLDAIAVRHIATTAPIGYDDWAAARFDSAATNAGQHLRDADPDGDHLPNLLEYALGGDPLDPTHGPDRAPRLALAEGRLSLTYRPAPGTTDVSCAVEWSEDLVTWDSSQNTLLEPEITPDGEWLVRTRYSLTERPRQFIRLRVTPLAP